MPIIHIYSATWEEPFINVYKIFPEIFLIFVTPQKFSLEFSY